MEVMTSNASGSATDLEDQSKQRNVNKNLSSPVHTTASQNPSSTHRTSTASPQTYDITTHKVIMANRRLSLVMAIIIVAFFPAILTGLIKMGSSWEGILMGGICLCVTLSMRILYLNHGHKLTFRKRASVAGPPRSLVNIMDSLPAAYYLYVLGSGGHTAEMLELVYLSGRPAPNAHRRYVFTTGDNNSLAQVFDLERLFSEAWPGQNGTWDTYQVERARNVHQPLYTAWFTSLLSLLSIFKALTTPPEQRRDPEEQKNFKFPHLIVTNGPGTGVMTAVVARLLKIFCYAPSHCMKVIFIETWAHVRTLSLTGKIFHWGRLVGGIVDVFLVQHGPLAEKYGYQKFSFIFPNRRSAEANNPAEAHNQG